MLQGTSAASRLELSPYVCGCTVKDAAAWTFPLLSDKRVVDKKNIQKRGATAVSRVPMIGIPAAPSIEVVLKLEPRVYRNIGPSLGYLEPQDLV